MKKSKLVALKEKLSMRSKAPWACFETSGFDEGGLGISMHWNPAFIKHLHEHGIQGITEQETLQLFFLFTASRISDSFVGEDTVNPEEMPTLTSEANTLVR